MRAFNAVLASCLLPLCAFAQSNANVPVIIIDQGNHLGVRQAPEIAKPVPGKGFANFPENAVTRVGENTTGQHVEAPLAATAPGAPSAPAAPGAPTLNAPATPPSPVAKLWPRDTYKIFMYPCVGLHEQFIQPCSCVINKLITTMPHDEFLRESEAGTIEKDPRLIAIRTDCASAPKKQQ